MAIERTGRGAAASSLRFRHLSRVVLEQEAVAGKTNELSVIPALINRLAEGDGLAGSQLYADNFMRELATCAL